MNAPPQSPSRGPAGVSGTPLSKLRCARHAEREAAACCAACGVAFCRECVSEHAGRLLCAACLGKTIEAERAHNKRGAGGFPAALRRVLVICASLAWLWLCFYLTALWINKIPRSVHEGTVWSTATEEEKGGK